MSPPPPLPPPLPPLSPGWRWASSVLALEAALIEGIQVIVMAAGVYPLDHRIIVNRSVTLRAAAVGQTVLDGQNSVGVLSVFGESTAVLLEGLNITNGSALSGGGVHVSAGATATFSRIIISGNTASADGGGVFVDAATLVITDQTSIMDNSANVLGGGIRAEALAFVSIMHSSQVSRNSATHFALIALTF